MTLLGCLIAFVTGAAFEIGCVFWVYYSEKNKAATASLWSMVNASMSVFGIESFLKSKLLALCYVLGYGFGTFWAVKIKQRWLR